MLAAEDLFDLTDFAHREIFDKSPYAWTALAHLDEYIGAYFATVGAGKSRIILQRNVVVDQGAIIEGQVLLGEGTHVEPGAYICGPAIIGANCQIRHGAYLRDSVLLGDDCVVGHATEVKHSILFSHAQAPHFAYVGDSILGNRVNLGAGTRLANWPLRNASIEKGSNQETTIKLRIGRRTIDTGLVKLGALLGDDVQVGCNAVTNPGCVVGPRTLIYALAFLNPGFHPSDRIIKLRQHRDVAPRVQ